jgi:hypothetical protein
VFLQLTRPTGTTPSQDIVNSLLNSKREAEVASVVKTEGLLATSGAASSFFTQLSPQIVQHMASNSMDSVNGSQLTLVDFDIQQGNAGRTPDNLPQRVVVQNTKEQQPSFKKIVSTVVYSVATVIAVSSFWGVNMKSG